MLQLSLSLLCEALREKMCRAFEEKQQGYSAHQATPFKEPLEKCREEEPRRWESRARWKCWDLLHGGIQGKCENWSCWCYFCSCVNVGNVKHSIHGSDEYRCWGEVSCLVTYVTFHCCLKKRKTSSIPNRRLDRRHCTCGGRSSLCFSLRQIVLYCMKG